MPGHNTEINFLDLVEEFLAALDSTADEGVYVISVAARLADMHPNTLRKYERAGILNPERTPGRQRLYSEEDIDVLRMVRALNSKYALSVQGTNLTIELINLFRVVLKNLEQAPGLRDNSTSLKLANMIREHLKRL